MNKEVKKLWIDALTSGEYKQGKEALRNTSDEYCCLGVLCDIYAKVKGEDLWKKKNESCEIYMFDKHVGTLPHAVSEWAEVSGGGSFTCNGVTQSLVTLNDYGTPFKQIAKIIEEKF